MRQQQGCIGTACRLRIDMPWREPGLYLLFGNEACHHGQQAALQETRDQRPGNLQGQIEERDERGDTDAHRSRTLGCIVRNHEDQRQQNNRAEHAYQALPYREQTRRPTQMRGDQRYAHARADARTRDEQQGLGKRQCTREVQGDHEHADGGRRLGDEGNDDPDQNRDKRGFSREFEKLDDPGRFPQARATLFDKTDPHQQHTGGKDDAYEVPGRCVPV